MIEPAFSTLGQMGLTLPELIEFATSSRCTAVELRVADGELVTPRSPADLARRVGERLADAGVKVLALNSYVAFADTAASSDDDLARHLDLADAAGASGVRVFMKAPTDAAVAQVRDVVAGRLDRLPGRGPARVLVETHDTHATGRALAEILDGHSSATVGVVWDTAHSWAAGEPFATSMQALAPWLAYLQIKDVASRDVPTPVALGAGAFPVAELAATLAAAGWDGTASLEWERAWHPELPALAHALAELPRWGAPLFDNARDDSAGEHA